MWNSSYIGSLSYMLNPSCSTSIVLDPSNISDANAWFTGFIFVLVGLTRQYQLKQFA